MQYKMKLAYAGLAAIIVWFGLGLQFFISVPRYMASGQTFAGAVIQILSFFTILTNLLVAVAYTCIVIIPNSKSGKYFSRPSVLTGIALYIAIVGFIYALVLRNLWNPQGLFKLADDLLHTISPILFVIFWLLFVPKTQLRWQLALTWLWFPFLYLIYTLIRGQILGVYPYQFMDISKLGYQHAAINCLLVLVAFLSFGGLFIAISRLFSKPETGKI